MAQIVSLKNPWKVIQVLATKPMSKWELKEKSGLEYPRVHEAVALLENDGYVKVYDEVISEKRLSMRIYGLRFKGAVAYLASISLEPPPQIGEPDESADAFKERYTKEKEKYIKHVEHLTKFLESYGKLLNYPIFKEIRWLAERCGRFIYHSILDVAKLTEAFPPFPSGASQMVKELRKQKESLRKEKWQMLRHQELREKLVVTVTEDGKETKQMEFDPFADVNQRLSQIEQELEMLLTKENEWWERGFAERLFERIVYLKSERKMHNDALHKFAEELLKKKKELEIATLEKAVKLFDGEKD